MKNKTKKKKYAELKIINHGNYWVNPLSTENFFNQLSRRINFKIAGFLIEPDSFVLTYS